MRTWPLSLAGLLLAALLVSPVLVSPVLAQAPTAKSPKADSPQTKRLDFTEKLHGVDVPDPYRWLEKDIREDGEVESWVRAQNAHARRVLDPIPERGAIEERLRQLWNYERYSTPWSRGGRYFFSKNDGLQNQSVLYTMDSLDGEPRVLVDPNSWSKDGTASLAGMSCSPDGRYFVYGKSDAGSDWRTYTTIDLRSGERVGPDLKWVKSSPIEWTADSRGFFYCRFDAPKAGDEYQAANTNQKLLYHTVGTAQEDDVHVFSTPHEPQWGFWPSVSDDGRHLVIIVWKAGPQNVVYYRDLTEPFASPREIIGGWDSAWSFIGAHRGRLLFQTDLDAPRGRVISLDPKSPARDTWRTVIAEGEDAIEDVDFVGGQLLVESLHNAATRVALYSPEGKLIRRVQFPGIGTARGFGGTTTATETFYSYQSFTQPPTVYRYDLLTGESRALVSSKVEMPLDQYEVKQVFYESKDGTKVPMFLAHRRGLVLDGNNPTLLYGYGGFGISITPRFSVSRAAWMEMGGVLAIPNLRGGGEFGEEWHQAGTKLEKQNVFDDFIAAAEWLIEKRYTQPKKLAIQGRSNGGLLVGAVMTQRPELFGAALPAVGVVDMLRFHKFTGGRYWTFDYGSPDEPEEFRALLAYSPYHNIQEGKVYPATMVTTADTDDRVVPAHSFKFAAALQRAQAGTAPVILRVESKAGHGRGVPTEKRIAEAADTWAFLVEMLGMELPQS